MYYFLLIYNTIYVFSFIILSFKESFILTFASIFSFLGLLFHWGNLRTIVKSIVHITMYLVCKFMKRMPLYLFINNPLL